MSLQSQFPSLVIRANAGSGKTFQLTTRLLQLLVAGEAPEKILATTFTRKAAGQIRQRVFSRLAKSASPEDHAKKLAQELSWPKLTMGYCRELLARVARAQHRLLVLTLDSFMVRIGRSFALEMGLSLSWKQIEDLEEYQIRVAALQRTFLEEDPKLLHSIIQALTKDQSKRSVFESTLERFSVLLSLYRNSKPGAWDWHFDFTPMTQDEWDAAFTTFTTLDLARTAAGALNQNWVNAHTKAVAELEARNWAGFLGGGIAKNIIFGESKFATKEISAAVRDSYSKFIDQAAYYIKNEVAQQTRAIAHFLSLFKRRLDAEFEGMQALTLQELKATLSEAAWRGELESLYYRLDSKISHLLFDEFQDTSREEWQVISPLVAEVLSQANGEKSFLCVGDVKQAIYGWRGGVAEIFDSLEERWPILRENGLALVKSYRSAPAVIETVNSVFESIATNVALEKYADARERWAKRFSPHATECQHEEGYVTLRVAPRASEDGEQSTATLKYAARIVKELSTRYPGASIAILLRRNEQINEMRFELSDPEIDIQASEEAGSRLVSSAAVGACLALLSLADNPGDRIARYMVTTSPLGDVVGFTRFADDERAAALSFEVRSLILRDGLGAYVSLLTRKISRLVDAKELPRIKKLVESAYVFQAQLGLRLRDFVEYVNRVRVEDPSASPVRIMTIHKSKGLEFDIVVLPELDSSLGIDSKTGTLLKMQKDPLDAYDRIVASSRTDTRVLVPEWKAMYERADNDQVVESLNGVYVALTRAKHALYMIVTPEKEKSSSSKKSESAAVAEVKYSADAQSVLCAALAPGIKREPEAVLFERGKKDWKFSQSFSGQVAVAAANAVVPCVSLKPPPPLWKRCLVRTSASELEGGQVVDLDARMRLGSPQAMARGTMMHALLASIDWVEERSLAGILDGFEVEAPELSTAERVSVVSELNRAMRQEAFLRLFNKKLHQGDSSYSIELWRERRFAVRRENEILVGTFDRVVLYKENGKCCRVELVDFKTDKLTNGAEQLDERIRFYKPQLELYCYALEKICSLPRDAIRAKFAFVAQGIVREVHG